jgi:hypothetical protein
MLSPTDILLLKNIAVRSDDRVKYINGYNRLLGTNTPLEISVGVQGRER